MALALVPVLPTSSRKFFCLLAGWEDALASPRRLRLEVGGANCGSGKCQSFTAASLAAVAEAVLAHLIFGAFLRYFIFLSEGHT